MIKALRWLRDVLQPSKAAEPPTRDPREARPVSTETRDALRSEESDEQFFRRLGGKYWTEQNRVFDELVAMRAVDRLVVALRVGNDDIRRKAAEILSNLHDPVTLEPLLQALHDPDNNVVAWAATGVGKIGNPAAVPALIELLRHTSSFVVQHVASALGDLGDARAVDSLLAIARHENAGMRAAAASVLDRFSELRAPAVVESLMTDGDRNVRIAAAASLARLGLPEGLAALVSTLRAKPDYDVGKQLQALDWKPESEEDAAYFLISSYYFAGMDQAGPGSVAILHKELRRAVDRNGDWSDCEKPAKALCRIGVPASLRDLEKFLVSDDYRERWQAARQIVAILEEGPSRFVGASLDDPTQLAGTELEIRKRPWVGLSWSADPNGVQEGDWKPVPSGRYQVIQVLDGWIYLRSSDVEYKVDANDIVSYWPEL